jgi:glycosyltransferase involved in cell wall biosynthesis
VREVRAVLDDAHAAYEILFVDDGSTDHSLQVMRELAEANPPVRYIAFAENRGQSAAFAAGFQEAAGELIVTMDADLQNDPADIPAMLALFDQGQDMVIGWRAKRKDTWLKRVGSRIGNSVRNRLTGENVHDTGCSLKIMRRDMAVGLPRFTGMHRFLPTLMKMAGARVAEIKVNHRPRTHGVSKYTNWQRALVGLSDVLGVRWLGRRYFDFAVKERGGRGR